MSDRLESLLRERRPDLDPGRDRERHLRGALELPAKHRTGTPPLSWLRRHRVVVVAAVLISAAATAWAADKWTEADLPAFGSGRDAWVLPTDDLLPDGTERTRAPLIEELPERPALLFAEGVSYRAALRGYGLARQEGRTLPRGTELVDPLPVGKTVAVRDDGRVMLDPAAPSGYDPESRAVFSAGWVAPEGQPPPQIPRCQLLLGADDVASPDCADESTPREWVREGVDGRWLESTPGRRQAPLRGSDRLSVLDATPVATERQRARIERLLATSRESRAVGGAGPLDPTRARLAIATPREIWLIPADGDGEDFCALAILGGGASSMRCDERRALVSDAYLGDTHFPSSIGLGPPESVTWGVVGDGFERAELSDGTTAEIVRNAFAHAGSVGADVVALEGPAGRVELEAVAAPPSDFAPASLAMADLTRAREIVHLDLAGGTRIAWKRAAVANGTGTCLWREHEGRPLAIACPESKVRASIDTIDLWSIRRGPRGDRSVVLQGEVASEVGSVEARFPDGTVKRAELADGLVLLEVTAMEIREGRTELDLVTVDRDGVALQSRRYEFPKTFGRG